LREKRAKRTIVYIAVHTIRRSILVSILVHKCNGGDKEVGDIKKGNMNLLKNIVLQNTDYQYFIMKYGKGKYR
jgi:hypothetical protein